MNTRNLISALSLVVSTVAHADPIDRGSDLDHPVAVTNRGLEVGVAVGYSQGGGDIGGRMRPVKDIAGAGVIVELDVGYRVAANLTLGAYGTFGGYSEGDQIDTNVLGATAGVQAMWHFRPDMSLDPFVSLGGGWKALWLIPAAGETTSLQGVDLARLQLGVDYRLSPELSIAPVVGGSLSLFVSQRSGMTDGYTEIEDRKLSFTGFAGLAARFGGSGAR